MLATALGWLGTAGTLGAYLMLSRGQLQADSVAYSLLNVVGGILGGVASIAFGAWPSVVANLVWAYIAGRSLADTLRTHEIVARAVERLRDRSYLPVGRASWRY